MFDLKFDENNILIFTFPSLLVRNKPLESSHSERALGELIKSYPSLNYHNWYDEFNQKFENLFNNFKTIVQNNNGALVSKYILLTKEHTIIYCEKQYQQNLIDNIYALLTLYVMENKNDS